MNFEETIQDYEMQKEKQRTERQRRKHDTPLKFLGIVIKRPPRHTYQFTTLVMSRTEFAQQYLRYGCKFCDASYWIKRTDPNLF